MKLFFSSWDSEWFCRWNRFRPKKRFLPRSSINWPFWFQKGNLRINKPHSRQRETFPLGSRSRSMQKSQICLRLTKNLFFVGWDYFTKKAHKMIWKSIWKSFCSAVQHCWVYKNEENAVESASGALNAFWVANSKVQKTEHSSDCVLKKKNPFQSRVSDQKRTHKLAGRSSGEDHSIESTFNSVKNKSMRQIC